jgi:predicted XRE-type DNA-binding protein
VFKLLKEKALKQRDIADLLGIKQPEVSHLGPIKHSESVSINKTAARLVAGGSTV